MTLAAELTPVRMVRVTVAGVLAPVNFTDDGWKTQEEFCGRPLHENCTLPMYPAAAVTLSVSMTKPLCVTVREVEAGTIVKTELDAVVFRLIVGDVLEPYTLSPP